jgi:hypothetical protein
MILAMDALVVADITQRGDSRGVQGRRRWRRAARLV